MALQWRKPQNALKPVKTLGEMHITVALNYASPYIYQSAQKITLGWGDEAKETPFGGLTWSGHFSGVVAYEGALDRVAVLENELAGARVERDVKLV